MRHNQTDAYETALAAAGFHLHARNALHRTQCWIKQDYQDVNFSEQDGLWANERGEFGTTLGSLTAYLNKGRVPAEMKGAW